MLKLRICPNCGAESRSLAAYFCHNCGERLPDNPDQPVSRQGDEADVQTGQKDVPVHKGHSGKARSKRINPTRIIKIALFVTFFLASTAALGYYVIYYLNNKATQEAPKGNKFRNRIVREDITFGNEPFVFGEDEIFELVPQDADFYLESKNPEIVLGYILTQDEVTLIEENTALTLEEAASFLNEVFVLVERENSLAFIAKVKAYDFVKNKIYDVGETEPWQATLVGDFLVVSNSSELIADIQKAFKKQILSLGLSSEFLNVQKTLPKDGQLFMYIPARRKQGTVLQIERGRMKLIPDALSGIGFVLKKDPKGTIIIGEGNGY